MLPERGPDSGHHGSRRQPTGPATRGVRETQASARRLLKDLRAKVDDGAEPVITQVGETSVTVAQLATDQTNCGYVIVALPRYSPESTLANIDLVEALLSQITLIARLSRRSRPDPRAHEPLQRGLALSVNPPPQGGAGMVDGLSPAFGPGTGRNPAAVASLFSGSFCVRIGSCYNAADAFRVACAGCTSAPPCAGSGRWSEVSGFQRRQARQRFHAVRRLSFRHRRHQHSPGEDLVSGRLYRVHPTESGDRRTGPALADRGLRPHPAADHLPARTGPALHPQRRVGPRQADADHQPPRGLVLLRQPRRDGGDHEAIPGTVHRGDSAASTTPGRLARWPTRPCARR
jgi:hypothetical protein